ncbi:O-antigen ligase family protein [Parvicella tangerina]|uniref:O-antigen ligase-related domain-containing protein n=1 Tax=Parvicella tangerina TaxID=2829795 RepID=A0A916JLM3_9FLAO|nr:O-antigen ligase family protein [Parvicella tangerina]CAG5078066.1 hypothetical protein CRYO30217_00563 [Parvicella tangerina]
MRKTDANHINFILIALTAFLIPLYQPLVRYSIGFLFLSTLFNTRKINASFLLQLSPLLLYFVWLCVGMLWTVDVSSGWKEIEHSLSFLIFPVVFGISKINIGHYINRIFSFFTFGVVVSLIICLAVAIYRFSLGGELKAFYYADLSYFHHPSYMAMYGNVSLIYLYLSLLNAGSVKTYYFKTSLSKFALISVISIFVLLLMSKAGIVTMLLINSIGLIAVFQKKRKLNYAFLTIFGLGLIAFGAYLTISPLQSRVDEVWNSLSSDTKVESSTGARLLVWEASWDIIKEQPLTGVGTGDLSAELDNLYFERNYDKLLSKSLNSHNQFLESWAKSGILGIITLIFMFFYVAWKPLWRFYLLFILLISINMLMESMLQIQSGIVFIAFMNSIFAVSVIRRKE